MRLLLSGAGLLFALGTAFVLGTLVAWPLGLGRLGKWWHTAMGVAGLAVSWAFMAFLPLPHVLRITVNGIPVYVVWAAVGTFMVGLVMALIELEEPAARKEEPPAPGAPPGVR